MKNNTVLLIYFSMIISYILLNLAHANPAKPNPSCNTLISYNLSSEMLTSTTKQPIAVKAYLEKIPVLANQDGILFKYTLADFTFTGLSPIENAEFINSINNDIYVFYKPNGTISELYGTKNIPLWNYNGLKSMILGMQVIQPKIDQSITTYQVEEQDDKGIVIANYEIISKQLLKKHRRSYKTLWNEDANVNLTNSNILIYFNADGIIQSIDIKEHISIGSQQQPLFSTDYTQQLTLNDIRQLATTTNGKCLYSSLAEAQTTEQLIKLPFSNIINQELLRQQKLQQLKDIHLDDLIHNLLPKDGKIEKPATIVASLIDLFTYYPNNLNKVISLLEQHPDDTQFSGYIIASIANADNAESQATLLNVMQRFKDNSNILIQSILAHHSVLNPVPANAEYLISLYQASNDQELKNLIVLAIGSLANRLDATKPEQQSHPVTDFIVDQLNKSTQRSISLVMIDALGNSGDTRAFPALRKIIENEQDPELIGMAIKTIKKMPLESVNPMLVEMLNTNNKNVTLAAILALQDRQLNNDAAIQKIIADYSIYGIELKIEALTLLSEPQIINKLAVSTFIHNRRINNQFSAAEIKVIDSFLQH